MNIHTNNMMDQMLDLIEEDIASSNGAIIADQHESSDEETDQFEVRIANNLSEQQFVDTYEVPKVLWDWEKITDWASRIKKYNQDQKKFYENMVPKIQEMKGVVASDHGWTLLMESVNDDIKIETKKSIRELTMMRATGTIDWPAKDIMRCM